MLVCPIISNIVYVYDSIYHELKWDKWTNTWKNNKHIQQMANLLTLAFQTHVHDFEIWSYHEWGAHAQCILYATYNVHAMYW